MREILSVRRPMVVGCAAIVLLIGGFGSWATLTTLAGAVIAPGQVEVERNRQVVQHPDGGIVAKINVTEGGHVDAGQILFELDGAPIRSDLAIEQNQYFELSARRDRLIAERDGMERIQPDPDLDVIASTRPEVRAIVAGQDNLFLTRLTSLRQEKDQLLKREGEIGDQIHGIDAQIEANRRQAEIAASDLVTQKQLLSRGIGQNQRVMSLEREVAQLTGAGGQLTASRAQAEAQITETDIAILKLGTARREEAITQLRDIEAHLLEVAERLRALHLRIDRLAIRAPTSGIVYDLTVTTPQSIVRPAEPILYIVPDDAALIVQARIPLISIDEVHVGQAVRMHFSAFQDRLSPDPEGQVRGVSADAFTDERTGQSYYRAEIVVRPQRPAGSDAKPILPGMQVEAYFQTGSRTPLSYLLQPFRNYLDHALREG